MRMCMILTLHSEQRRKRNFEFNLFACSYSKPTTHSVSIIQTCQISIIVSYDGLMSSEFPCQKGVRQGCPLSPLLFSLYISDLEHILLSQSSGRVRIGEQEITVIMFADDLVLLADSSEGLQQSLTVLYNYCQSWQL